MTKNCASMSRYISEFIGTTILVFMGVGSSVIAGKLIGNIGISFSFGLTLMFLIYALGPISGCHVNPAVSLGMLFAGKQNVKDTILYIIFQLLGGILGAYMVYWIATGKGDFNLAQGLFATGFMEHSPEHYSLFSGSLVEIFMTIILVFVVLATTSSQFALAHAGLAIGAALTAIHLVSLPVTNTSVNLARSLGPALLVGGWAMSQLWMFIVAHIIAAVVAVIFYKIIYCESNN